ncbi:S46 family peptidase [Brumimicrobium aurantiacum]|uniref:Dipeptidyl-peptidase n=1 Tax=Brumimicrobium aurantiacum TaxID=1737063 RepID=A0A3E1F0C3_9FLAO|nr:S46 family peptidase [Brumimicrobium aurantiacum]RFC55279.1 S46 family peptidase [Brumimicrobium aurantiacum]
MKKQIIALTFISTLLFSGFAKADEGMWLPFLLGRNYEDMKKHGLNLTQEEIYSINNSSLKDAIVSFGGFCTAEVISDQGLILTNHHCGYDAIAEASTEEENHLDNGFWAKNHKEEIAIPGLTATFIISIDDVTEQITKNLTDDMTEEERATKIKEISAQLTKEAVGDSNYKAFVRDFFEGNEFYIFVTETYQDVRLAGTPPESIGKFGHDSDNWMYPRHTGDFSLFRIYSGEDNKPAAYSENNKPYTPKHSLPVSIKGYEKGDFAMVFGFPGSTDRYLSSFGVEQAVSLEQPKRVEIRKVKLDIMKKYMKESTEVRLNYASKHAQVANYWKYFIGQSEQLKNNKVADKKRELEARFTEFAEENPQYAEVLPMIENTYKFTNNSVYANVYQSEFIYSVDLNLNVFRFVLLENYVKQGMGDRAYASFKERLMSFYETANMDLEFETLEAVLKMYYKDIPEDMMPELIQKAGDKGKLDKLVKKARKKSIFASKESFEKFDAKVQDSEEFPIEKLKKDPLFQIIESIYTEYEALTSDEEYIQQMNNLKRANRLFVKGYREMDADKTFYPNANSTLRLTYGSILPYSPEEGKEYGIYTTLEEGLKKEDPNNPEFHVSPKLKELFKNKDYGRYANDKGEMVVNFISNNDITGGNSGSPVINADGELIGTAFDGNWEAMSGDIFFEKDIQRTISCDIRYVLFIIEKYGEAHNLIEEMEIVE